MVEKRTGSYGTWSSPITSDAITGATLSVSDPRIDGTNLYWTEERPSEDGRTAIVVRRGDGTTSTITPTPFNVRSEIHSYGGGAYEVEFGVVYFVDVNDRSIYSQKGTGAPVKITPDSKALFADFCVDHERGRLIAVREEKSSSGAVINSLVAVDLADGRVTSLHEKSDFYSSPVLSPDNATLAWLIWQHPNMPWTSTQLSVAAIDPSGALAGERVIAGDPTKESIFQPQWSPDGKLYFISDRTDFWNIYRWNGTDSRNVLPRQAEFGVAQWELGMSTYAFVSVQKLIYVNTTNGIWRLGMLDVSTGETFDYEQEFLSLSGVRANNKIIAVRYSTPESSAAIATINVNTGEPTPVKISIPPDTLLEYQGYLSRPQALDFPTGNNERAYAFFYPPANKDWQAPESDKPQLIVMSHGGPTSMTNSGLNLKIQFWTSRGFGVLDVNYRGSTGYGRQYRERLYGQWGLADVADCIAGAQSLVAIGKVDRSKMAITGGCAGGYTTLCALTFHKDFAAGASYYGISDLVALTSTHKFESHYMDWLVEPYRPGSTLYHDRSPNNFVEQLSAPIIFFQGALDPAVPPDQATKMFAALMERKISTAAYIFEGEKHGFRQPRHKRIALEAELQFYLANLVRN
jgi:dipeptidyl aminopeptidase/acylaminoacyl peptidase